MNKGAGENGRVIGRSAAPVGLKAERFLDGLDQRRIIQRSAR